MSFSHPRLLTQTGLRLHVQFDDGGCTRLFEVYSALHGALGLTGKGTACRARGGGLVSNYFFFFNLLINS